MNTQSLDLSSCKMGLIIVQGESIGVSSHLMWPVCKSVDVAIVPEGLRWTFSNIVKVLNQYISSKPHGHWLMQFFFAPWKSFMENDKSRTSELLHMA